MSRREKIIVALMFLAIAAGGYILLTGRGGTVPGGSPAAAAPDLDRFIAAIQSRIAALDQKSDDLYALAKAGAAWTRDPFLRGGVPTDGRIAAGTARAAPPPALHYTGFIEIAGRRLAVINGQEYESGERIAATGHSIREIAPTHVRLDAAAGGGEARLPLEEGAAGDDGVQRE
jgi:hypothetical protein